MRRLHSYNPVGLAAWEMESYAILTERRYRRRVWQQAERLVALLAGKGVLYDDLGPALVPGPVGHEVMLLFDIEAWPESGNYATEAGRALIESMTAGSSHAIATGDLTNPYGKDLRTVFPEMSVSEGYVGRAAHCYAALLTNVDDRWLARAHQRLSKTEAYIGAVSEDWSSATRAYLQAVLVPTYLKHGRTVISVHEAEVPDEENSYIESWPWPGRTTYQCRTVPEALWDPFLTYRVEQSPAPAFVLDPTFLEALFGTGSGALESYRSSVAAGLESADRAAWEATALHLLNPGEIADLILERIERGYVYGVVDEPDGTVSFRVGLVVDGRPPRGVRVDLGYRAEPRQLVLVSLS
ncbi:hypothetical protein [Actinoplanes sp. NPDC051411]|uniref:hypothetical protein n=1 Tax=Actinoplanes sp. NPDC051411 TaxID=3155522 RepID=UPI003425ACE3